MCSIATLVGIGELGELGNGAVQDCVGVESTPACRDGVVRERVELVVGESAQRLAQVKGRASIVVVMGEGDASETSFGEAGEEMRDAGSASGEVWVRGVDQSVGLNRRLRFTEGAIEAATHPEMSLGGVRVLRGENSSRPAFIKPGRMSCLDQTSQATTVVLGAA